MAKYKVLDSAELKASFMKECSSLSEDADEDLLEYVAEAAFGLLEDQDSHPNMSEAWEEGLAPYLSAFLDEEQATAVLEKVLATASLEAPPLRPESAPEPAPEPAVSPEEPTPAAPYVPKWIEIGRAHV